MYIRLADENSISLLEGLITAPQVPIIVIRQSANMLIKCAISEEALPEATSACRLLSIIKQRHPTAFSQAADAVCEEDEDVRASVEQLIISLSVVRYLTMVQRIS
jgi:U3 small nucleolar RNA-associated protein 10